MTPLVSKRTRLSFVTWISEVRALSLGQRTLGLLNDGRRGEGKADGS